ncbi:GntR family transcriptional regulator [Sinirhodobacter sp. WL0062]|uniref:GntR family transcriptional regulator n=1 Tax=Rhodobacter flavimaris TaxID=2907145 RepID=A0ABS8YZA5_9RHOB|nr:GntR family transcriptional regulator [Sinirhodobacter sp. WL0062]MCE5975121.1 GntR family transcriptional regulator [Sinirhodobacter sp. WL0062]
MTDPVQLPQLDLTNRPSVADLVFAELQRQVLSLELQPGAKISEVDVAKQMGVSRQPVRDAFYRLSKMGFLLIRPQRATTVTLISSEAVMQARFIRTALEVETVRVAAEALGNADIEALERIIDAQDKAIKAEDKPGFHRLDDQFHREICMRSGLGFTWELIAENKGHMDRVRMLSLIFASRAAWEDHLRILDALKSRNPEASAEAMRAHLSRIKTQIERIRSENFAWFAKEE